jgi:uncharacterized protein (TIGR03437 family)
MNTKPLIRALVALAVLAGSIGAGTLGRVVPIGGQGADLALDEARGVLYIANYTANRIEVMSLSNYAIQTSINVPSQPSSIALSPDGRYLVIAHYGNFAPPASSGNALTVIELESNSRQTFAMGTAPLGVAFGLDNRALVVTTQEFIVFDPVSGTTQVIATLAELAAKTLPQPAASFPANIVSSSVAASGDGLWIWGFGDNVMFRYDVANRALSASLYTASPALGPRAVSVSQDGRRTAMGWAIQDFNFYNLAEYSNPSGVLNLGTVLLDSARGLVYGQVASKDTAPAAGEVTAPILHVGDWDNLATRERIQLPENLAGKSVLSSDGATMYSISDSGVMVLPVGQLERYARVVPQQEDLVFRGNFCARTLPSQPLTIVDPSGGNTPFTLTVEGSGLRLSQTTGVTPATIQVSVDSAAVQNQKGTSTATIRISSPSAVNVPETVRVLINNKEPDQRGTFVNVPGKLTDLVADPVRDRFYVLRQDKNQVLVFDGANSTKIATLRTCTKPMSMAVTFDRQNLLVGCDRSHFVNVYDLETLEPTQSIRMERGDYVQSIATSNRAILATTRSSSGGDNGVHKIDLITRTSTRLPSLGIFENKIAVNTVVTGSPNGSTILFASSDGTVMLYDANVDTFTVSRKDGATLSGSFAASSFDQYVVGNQLLNRSLVKVATFESGSGQASGFAFVDNEGFRTTAASAASPGVIQRVTSNGSGIRATRMTEAPLLGATGAAFTRTIAPLYSRNAIVNLTTSGFTVLPWTYDDSVAPPRLSRVVNAADQSGAVAPGGLVTIQGTNLSPVNVASSEKPLPTALGESCLTVNGLPLPVLFVSPTQINAQLPFQATGNVALILRTPGGVSDTYNLTIQPQAPSVFRASIPGLDDEVPNVVRIANSLPATDSNPVHRNDSLTIYLTGLGQTNPAVENGMPSPADPIAAPLVAPTVKLGGVNLQVTSAGLIPGEVGIYQISVSVPRTVPLGLSVPMEIRQGSGSTTVNLRVVE